MSLSAWPELIGFVFVMCFVVRPLGIFLARVVETSRPIGPDEKIRLTCAFEALGPERVKLGLASAGHDWSDCFLALATCGEPHAKLRVLRRHGWPSRVRFLSALVGVPPRALKDVVRVWDRNEPAFRRLAAEWLEQTPVPTAGSVEDVFELERAS